MPNRRKDSSERIQLRTILKDFTTGDLRVPDWQRSPVWSLSKQKLWIESLMRGLPLPTPILTYTTTESRSIKLLDGLQRLTALKNAQEEPFLYGCDKDTIAQLLEETTITCIEITCENEGDALVAFQHANMGTSLTPLEFYRGELVTAVDGRIGLYLYDRVNEIVGNVEYGLCTKTRRNSKAMQDKYTRGALALFMQYITEWKRPSFWGYASLTEPTRALLAHQVEHIACEYVKSKPRTDIDRDLARFEAYLGSLAAMIEDALIEYQRINGGTVSLHRTMLRAAFHMGLYVKNNQIGAESYQQFLPLFIEHDRTDDERSAVLKIPKKDEGTEPQGVQLQDLKRLFLFARHHGLEMEAARKSKRRVKVPTKRGYDSSHTFPWSEVGDGDHNALRPEPAIINRARGAKPAPWANGSVPNDQHP